MEKFVPLSVPNLSGKELEYITKAIETEWISTAGSYISEFEKKISEYVIGKESVACQSGTAGLHLALLASGVTSADAVIVPTLTFIATVNPVKYIGAEPIFMDCNDMLTMDTEKLKLFCKAECEFFDGKLIHKQTKRIIKAVIVTHIFGNMADMECIIDIGKEYGFKVIEDAAEALGTYYIKGKYKGKYAGTIGDIGVFSFNGNKIITTGGGGMIVSNNKKYLERCRYLSTQAKDDTLYFVHNEVGYNYRMTNIQAALGLAQLEQLENFIETKKNNYFEYINNGIPLMKFREDIRPNYWFYSYITENRDKVMNFLIQNKIQTRPIWKLIHTQKPYGQCYNYNIEKATYFVEHVLNLPCSSNLLREEVKLVAQVMKEVIC